MFVTLSMTSTQLKYEIEEGSNKLISWLSNTKKTSVAKATKIKAAAGKYCMYCFSVKKILHSAS